VIHEDRSKLEFVDPSEKWQSKVTTKEIWLGLSQPCPAGMGDTLTSKTSCLVFRVIPKKLPLEHAGWTFFGPLPVETRGGFEGL
jgi:hypothetical protein